MQFHHLLALKWPGSFKRHRRRKKFTSLPTIFSSFPFMENWVHNTAIPWKYKREHENWIFTLRWHDVQEDLFFEDSADCKISLWKIPSQYEVAFYCSLLFKNVGKEASKGDFLQFLFLHCHSKNMIMKSLKSCWNHF